MAKEDKNTVANAFAASAGISEDRAAAMLSEISEKIDKGEFRTAISCSEARMEFITMAWNVFVHGGQPRFPIDAEVGLHIVQCEEPDCRKLVDVYETHLKFTSPSDVSQIREYLTKLQKEILQ